MAAWLPSNFRRPKQQGTDVCFGKFLCHSTVSTGASDLRLVLHFLMACQLMLHVAVEELQQTLDWTRESKMQLTGLQDLRIDSKSKAFLSHQLLTQGMPECKNHNRQSVIIRYHKCQVFSTRLRHHKSNGWVTPIKRKRIYMTLSSALFLNMKQNLRQK